MSLYLLSKIGFEKTAYLDKKSIPYLLKEEISKTLENPKIFKIDSDIVNILSKTDVEIGYTPAPFKDVFIDAEIPINENVILQGLAIQDYGPSKDIEDKKYYGQFSDREYKGILSIYFRALEKREGKWLDYYGGTMIPTHIFKPDYNKDISEFKYELDSQKFKEQIGLFVLAFLNFINNPEIEIVHRERTDKKIESVYEKKGKIINKEDYYIKLTGKVRKYVDDFNQDNEKISRGGITHASIVRGFFRTYTSEVYVNLKGKRVWIAPFVRGLGEIREKQYLVSDKKVFINEMRMVELIKELYPDKFIVTNTRGFLDGLEMDCYIPSLKLGFEYNGEQHYNWIQAFHKTKEEFKAQKERDILKNKTAEEKGITLITIKYDDPLNKDLILHKINIIKDILTK